MLNSPAALASLLMSRTGEMVLLSEQQLVDCAGAYDNHGCSGGLPSHAFEYIASTGGLDTEQAYPYLAEESGSCSFYDKGVGADVLRSVNITFQDEAELLEAVGNTGPVSVAFQVKVFATGFYFRCLPVVLVEGRLRWFSQGWSKVGLTCFARHGFYMCTSV